MDTTKIKNFYNEAIKGKYGRDYERKRWFSSDISAAGYEMTRCAIERHLLDSGVQFNECIEIGPGEGTWTKLFYDRNPVANFDLVDISSEMLKLAKNKLGEGKNIRYFENDFIDFETPKYYDLFFSCRALEYFPLKDEFVSRIFVLLKNGGIGFIITKTPKYFINKLLGRKTREPHTGQISSAELGRLLIQAGFSKIEKYPVTMSFPLFKSAIMNKFLYKLFGGRKLNFLSQFFSESYCIKFQKP